MNILFVAAGQPGPLDGGGPRRTYQMIYEFGECFGVNNVHLITAGELMPQYITGREKLLGYYSKLMLRARNTLANPYKLLVRDGYGLVGLPQSVKSYYRDKLQSIGKVDLCVLEDTRFGSLVEFNNTLGIKTVVAPWSFESLTHNINTLFSGFREDFKNDGLAPNGTRIRSTFTDLANEMMVYSKAIRNWFLSEIEAGFAMAAGLTAAYFPYYPIGEAKEALNRVRNMRTKVTIDSNLFVVSAGNIQNRIALEEFLIQLKGTTLPRGVRVAIVGFHEEPTNLASGIEFLGRLPLNDFEDLLTRTRAVLIPQNCGFGCITRVADMLCAGIPVIADQIVANATGKLPGAVYVEYSNGGWPAAIERALCAPLYADLHNFEDWQASMRYIVTMELGRMSVT